MLRVLSSLILQYERGGEWSFLGRKQNTDTTAGKAAPDKTFDIP